MSDISKLTVKGKVCSVKDALARKLGGTDNPIRLPFCVEKDGVRYSCDIADDAEGIDWVITKAQGRRT